MFGIRRLLGIMLLLFLTNFWVVFGQEKAESQTVKSQAESSEIVQPGFKQIVFGGGMVNFLIWGMIFMASFATVTFIIDGIAITKRRRLLPENVISGVKSSLEKGDLNESIDVCEKHQSPLSNILMAGFSSISNGFEHIQEAVSVAADLESEKILQRINYLNLCGQISPMLGLLGTVVGMVKAFAGLAGEAGAAKAQLLALAISGALWTTVAGLLISVPALLAYTIFKNVATRILLESQATVLDLLKILRTAEVED
jgi:biopolymer transport protein ExbB